ncbi:hypothetical protein BRD56_08715 [Thermoplasmatales archaeon SW_10_69_26]|nr:MAG: hypothetical protein BRD56_08715 [Thermoplasmatales archaeon SW_10_69_26]
MAEAVARQQSGDLGIPSDEPPTTGSASSLFAALESLTHRHATILDLGDRLAAQIVEQRSPGLADALADLVTTFLRLEAVSDTSVAKKLTDDQASPARLSPAAGTGAVPGFDGGLDPFPHVEGGELADVFAARSAFLNAVENLAMVAESSTSAARPAVDACPAVALDTSDESRTFANDCALIVSFGGDDEYENNAGGTGATFPAAAVVDLGGDDTYGQPSDPRCCGVNGGGFEGTGVLVDATGNDTYHANARGVNGGADNGIGLLVDAGEGTDRYLAGHEAEERCEAEFCVARAGSAGVNGGAHVGVGSLIDGGGEDAFLAGVNASVTCEGSKCSAVAGGLGVNGGGYSGSGSLVSSDGDDVYQAGTNATTECLGDASHLSRCLSIAGGHGANGGGHLGVGRLVDAGGDDVYEAGVDVHALCQARCETYPGVWGTNGGATAGWGSSLVDLGGVDAYRAAVGEDLACDDPCMHGDWNGENGLLVDGDGTGDRYEDPDLACTDCSRTPRGVWGAMLDRDLSVATESG